MLLIEPPCATDGGRVARNWDAKIKIFNFPFLALCKKGKVEVARFHLKRMVIITVTAKKFNVDVWSLLCSYFYAILDTFFGHKRLSSFYMSFTHISHKSKGCRSWWIESQIFQKVKVLQYSEKETWRNLVSLLVRFQYFQAVCPIFSIWRLKYKPFRLRMWTQRSFQSCLETSEGLKSVMKLYKVNTDAPRLFGIFLNLSRNRNRRRKNYVLKGNQRKKESLQ